MIVARWWGILEKGIEKIGEILGLEKLGKFFTMVEIRGWKNWGNFSHESGTGTAGGSGGHLTFGWRLRPWSGAPGGTFGPVIEVSSRLACGQVVVMIGRERFNPLISGCHS